VKLKILAKKTQMKKVYLVLVMEVIAVGTYGNLKQLNELRKTLIPNSNYNRPPVALKVIQLYYQFLTICLNLGMSIMGVKQGLPTWRNGKLKKKILELGK